MSTVSEWLHLHIWPEIEAMMLNDAHFRMVIHARRLTKKFNGPTAKLLQDGYLVQQMVTIRRLCDRSPDVYSLHRALVESKNEKPEQTSQIDALLQGLKQCDHVPQQVNKHVAHTADPAKSRGFVEWEMGMLHLEEAHKVICRAAIVLERDILRVQNRIEIIPVPQFDVMEDLRLWVPDQIVDQLHKLWHAHRREVNSWKR